MRHPRPPLFRVSMFHGEDEIWSVASWISLARTLRLVAQACPPNLSVWIGVRRHGKLVATLERDSLPSDPVHVFAYGHEIF